VELLAQVAQVVGAQGLTLQPYREQMEQQTLVAAAVAAGLQQGFQIAQEATAALAS
jgi:hypothetical protein